MIANRVSYTLASTLETVNYAESAAEKFAAETGFRNDELQEISMAVREATVNAVLHGNKYDANKRVHLTFERRPGILEISVRDEGNGFDPTTLPDPLAPENLLKQSGRGIFLIRSYMDEVEFRKAEPGTEMKLIKHVRGAAADKEKPNS